MIKNMPRSKQMGDVVEGKIVALSQQSRIQQIICCRFFKECCRTGFNGTKKMALDADKRQQLLKTGCLNSCVTRDNSNLRQISGNSCWMHRNKIDSSSVHRKLINAGLATRR